MNHEYYLNIAKEASKASKCLSSHWGVVIVKNDMILGIGYNGPARGVRHCNPCKRLGFSPGQGYDKCSAVHAEANAIIQSGGRERCIGSSLYISSHNRIWDASKSYNTKLGNFPCNNCTRLIVNAGISYIIHMEDKVKIYDIKDLLERELIE